MEKDKLSMKKLFKNLGGCWYCSSYYYYLNETSSGFIISTFELFLKMAHLQTYSQQMGGFDFTLTQRYYPHHPETKCSRIKTSSRQSPIRKQAPPSSDASIEMESCSLPIPEPPEDPSSSKRTAKKSTTLLPISMLAEQEQPQTHSSSTFSWAPTSNCKDSTLADKPEWAHTSPQHPHSSTDTKVISAPIWSSAATMSSVLTSSCSALRESTFILTQLLLPSLRNDGLRISPRHNHFVIEVQGRHESRGGHSAVHRGHHCRYLPRLGFGLKRRLLRADQRQDWNVQKRCDE